MVVETPGTVKATVPPVPRDTAWAMSQENLEIVRRFFDAWNRRDEEALLALADPEVEYVNSPTAIEPGTRHGTNEGLAVVRTQWEFLRDGRNEIDRTYDRGEEVFVLAPRFPSDAGGRDPDRRSSPCFGSAPRWENRASRGTRLRRCGG